MEEKTHHDAKIRGHLISEASEFLLLWSNEATSDTISEITIQPSLYQSIFQNFTISSFNASEIAVDSNGSILVSKMDIQLQNSIVNDENEINEDDAAQNIVCYSKPITIETLILNFGENNDFLIEISDATISIHDESPVINMRELKFTLKGKVYNLMNTTYDIFEHTFDKIEFQSLEIFQLIQNLPFEYKHKVIFHINSFSFAGFQCHDVEIHLSYTKKKILLGTIQNDHYTLENIKMYLMSQESALLPPKIMTFAVINKWKRHTTNANNFGLMLKCDKLQLSPETSFITFFNEIELILKFTHSAQIQVGEVFAKYQNMQFHLKHCHICGFFQTNNHYFSIDSENVKCLVNDFIQFRTFDKNCLLLLYKILPGKIPELFISLQNMIFSYPFTFPDIKSLLPNQTKLVFHFEHIFIDIVAKNFAARMLAEINTFNSSMEINSPTIFGEFSLNSKLYLSNIRNPLPLKLFQLRIIPYDEYGFAKIGEIHAIDSSFRALGERVQLHFNQPKINLSFCADSYEATVSILSYIISGECEEIESTEILESQLQESLTASVNQDAKEVIQNNSVKQDFEPSFASLFVTSFDDVELQINFFAGFDLSEIFDLKILNKQLPYTDENIEPCDFVFVTRRDESQSLQLSMIANISVHMRPNIFVSLNASTFNIIDSLPNSPSKLLLGNESKLIMKSMIDSDKKDCKMMIDFQEIGLYITHEQIRFLSEFFSHSHPYIHTRSSKMLSFSYFSISPIKIRLAANFKYFLNVNIEDVDFEFPFFSCGYCEDSSILFGELAEFYLNQVNRPGFLDIISGLPALSNLKRLANAFKTLFTFDISKFGFFQGFGKASGALLQTIATEAISVTTGTANVAERFISYAVNSIAGDENQKMGFQTALATLIITTKTKLENGGASIAAENVLRQIPRLILTPGLVVIDKTTQILNQIKEKINPNADKDRKYQKT